MSKDAPSGNEVKSLATEICKEAASGLGSTVNTGQRVWSRLQRLGRKTIPAAASGIPPVAPPKVKKFGLKAKAKLLGVGAAIGGGATYLASKQPASEQKQPMQTFAGESWSDLRDDFEKLSKELPSDDLERIAQSILEDMQEKKGEN